MKKRTIILLLLLSGLLIGMNRETAYARGDHLGFLYTKREISEGEYRAFYRMLQSEDWNTKVLGVIAAEAFYDPRVLRDLVECFESNKDDEILRCFILETISTWEPDHLLTFCDAKFVQDRIVDMGRAKNEFVRDSANYFMNAVFILDQEPNAKAWLKAWKPVRLRFDSMREKALINFENMYGPVAELSRVEDSEAESGPMLRQDLRDLITSINENGLDIAFCVDEMLRGAQGIKEGQIILNENIEGALSALNAMCPDSEIRLARVGIATGTLSKFESNKKKLKKIFRHSLRDADYVDMNVHYVLQRLQRILKWNESAVKHVVILTGHPSAEIKPDPVVTKVLELKGLGIRTHCMVFNQGTQEKPLTVVGMQEYAQAGGGMHLVLEVDRNYMATVCASIFGKDHFGDTYRYFNGLLRNSTSLKKKK